MKKSYKKIMANLYLIGVSKNNIYSTMKNNGLDVKRKDVRNYLKSEIRGRTEQYSRYRSRYANALQLKKSGIITDVKKERDRLNKNYLTYITIKLLKDKKIKYSKDMRKIAIKNMSTESWESP